MPCPFKAKFWQLTNIYSPVVRLTLMMLMMFSSSSRQMKPVSTVTTKLQPAVLLLASFALQFTFVAPAGKVEPDGGTQVTVSPGQLSEIAGFGKVTVVFVVVKFAGQVIVGGWVSLTVTVKVTDPPPVVLHVTLVEPTGKKEPEAGVQVASAQAPDPGGNETFAPHWPAVLLTVMLGGFTQGTIQTVTEKEPRLLFES